MYCRISDAASASKNVTVPTSAPAACSDSAIQCTKQIAVLYKSFRKRWLAKLSWLGTHNTSAQHAGRKYSGQSPAERPQGLHCPCQVSCGRPCPAMGARRGWNNLPGWPWRLSRQGLAAHLHEGAHKLRCSRHCRWSTQHCYITEAASCYVRRDFPPCCLLCRYHMHLGLPRALRGAQVARHCVGSQLAHRLSSNTRAVSISRCDFLAAEAI